MLVLGMVTLSGAWLWCAGSRIAAADGQPRPAAQAPGQGGQQRIDAADRCPVCGMFPAKRPESAAAMMLDDGRAFYFCGNGCLLRAWRFSKRHLGVAQARIAAMYVQDYFNGSPLDARQAWWVAGSDVLGPMGPALVTLGREQDVAAFRQRHGGRVVFKLAQLDDALWESLFPSKKKP